MTIKEVEARSGMTRANIRFYEAEGLLVPSRSENGYRDYSEEDLDILLRIKLLRFLHISLDQIKELQAGRRELADVLDSQLEELAVEQASLEHAQAVCREMRAASVSYQALDARKYLDDLEKKRTASAPELAEDQMPKYWGPWRRLFARQFDISLYALFWELLLLLVFHVRLTGLVLAFTSAAGLVTMLFLEPLLLRLFCTTPGKWLMGMRVTDLWGHPLTYQKGLARTWSVLWRGMGLNISFYRLVRLFKSYLAYSKEEDLPWEGDSELVVKDDRGWRCAALAGSYLLSVCVLVFAVLSCEMPLHRGDLTVAEFCENYNRYVDYYDPGLRYRLDSRGNWLEDWEPGVAYIDLSEGVGRPELSFTEEGGFVTGITMEQEYSGQEQIFAPSYQNEMTFSILSFVLAQEGADPIFPETNEVIRRIQEYPYQNFSTSVYGVEIQAEYDQEGYLQSSSQLVGQEGENWSFSFRFTMKKTD